MKSLLLGFVFFYTPVVPGDSCHEVCRETPGYRLRACVAAYRAEDDRTSCFMKLDTGKCLCSGLERDSDEDELL